MVGTTGYVPTVPPGLQRDAFATDAENLVQTSDRKIGININRRDNIFREFIEDLSSNPIEGA